MKKEKNIYLFILICGVCCGPISTGYILGYSSPTLRDLSGILTTGQKSTFASLLFIGGIIGSIIIGYMMDKYGRRLSILYSSVPAIMGWLIIIGINYRTVSYNNHVFLLYLSRILSGISCGMNMACTTVYLIEVSPTEWRGTIASLNQVGITVGIFLSYTFGKFLIYDKSAIIALMFALGLYITSIFIPESQRWISNKDLSKSSLNKDYDAESVIINESSFNSENHSKPQIEPISLMTMFNDKYRSKTLVIIRLLFLQQFTGINAFISYADILFINLISNTSIITHLPMAIGIVQIIFTVIAASLIDRYGRKSFLKVAGLTMASSMLLLMISYKMRIESLIMFSTALYIVGFSVGWGPIPVISSTEMLPQEARSSGGSIAVLTSWIGGYIMTSTFPLMNYTLGETNVFLMFGIICAYGVYYVEKKLPETKGLSLDNISV